MSDLTHSQSQWQFFPRGEARLWDENNGEHSVDLVFAMRSTVGDRVEVLGVSGTVYLLTAPLWIDFD